MNSTFMLDLVAYAIVAICALVAWRKLRPRKARATSDGCGACGGCGDEQKACASAALSPPPADPPSR